jgi:hypothetical protein
MAMAAASATVGKSIRALGVMTFLSPFVSFVASDSGAYGNAPKG